MRSLALFLAAALVGCNASPEDQRQSRDDNQADAARGQKVALASGDFTSCLVCHGVRLQGNASLSAPALAHLPADYLEAQLKAYRAGWRGTHVRDHVGANMQVVAALMDDATIAAAVAYVGSFERTPDGPFPQASEPGGTLYAERCAACHGDEAQGLAEHGAPPLVGFDTAYFSRQMRHYRDGVRGYHEDDASGNAMAVQAEGLSDSDLESLATFLYP